MVVLLLWIVEHLWEGDGYIGLFGFDSSERNQRQADIPHSLEQAMECCLVGDKATNEGGAVALLGEAQSVKPGRRASPHMVINVGDLEIATSETLSACTSRTAWAPEGTRLTNTADLSGHGPLRLLAPLAAGRGRDAVAANLDKLRDLLESSA
jgi:hypothetical protein